MGRERKPLVKLVWLWGHFFFSVYPANECNPSYAFLAIGGYPFPEFAVWLTTGASWLGLDLSEAMSDPGKPFEVTAAVMREWYNSVNGEE